MFFIINVQNQSNESENKYVRVQIFLFLLRHFFRQNHRVKQVFFSAKQFTFFYQNTNPIKFNLQSHTISIKNYTHKFTLKEPILSNPFSRTIFTKHNIYKTCREFYSTTNITNIHIKKIHTKPIPSQQPHIYTKHSTTLE